MKRVALICGILVGLVRGISSAADVPPEKLALTDLVNRPDRWPTSVVLQHDYKFNNGAVLHQGDKAKILSFDGAHVVLLGGGKIRFPVTPDDCALLDSANQVWAGLTTAQRAVDPNSLAADVTLWPTQVKTNTTISCKWGKLAPDTVVNVVDLNSRQIDIAWPNSPNRISINYLDNDAIDRARQLVLLDPDKRPSRVAAALEPILVDAGGKPVKDANLQEKKFFALYFGANWCAPCHAFSPSLVKFMNETGASHPELVTVFLDEDNDAAQMLAYMNEAKMPFAGAANKDWTGSPLLGKLAAKIIPQFVVVDRFGRVLASNDDLKGNRGDPADTVLQLNKMLEAQGAGK